MSNDVGEVVRKYEGRILEVKDGIAICLFKNNEGDYRRHEIPVNEIRGTPRPGNMLHADIESYKGQEFHGFHVPKNSRVTVIDSCTGCIESIRDGIAYLILAEESKAWEIEVRLNDIKGNPAVGDEVSGMLCKSGRIKFSEWYAMKPACLAPEEEKQVRKEVKKELGQRSQSF